MTREDQLHVNTAYAHLKETLDELAQVFEKDNYLAHMQTKLYALEDTLYQYVNKPKEA